MKKHLIIVISILSANTLLIGQSSYLDPHFADQGRYIKDWGGPYQTVTDAKLQSDGKILVVGTCQSLINLEGIYDLILQRLTQNGALDSSFGANGIVRMVVPSSLAMANGSASSATILILADGRIRVVENIGNIGFTGFVWGLNADGSIDSSFATNGCFANSTIGEIIKLVLDNNGNIFEGGNVSIPGLNDTLFLKKLNPSGQLDPTYGTNGTFYLTHGTGDELTDIALDNNNRILLAGFIHPGSLIPYISRLNPDGTIDSTFGINGTFFYYSNSNYVVAQIGVKPNNNILLSITSQSTFHDLQILQITDQGMLDSSFGNQGLKTIRLTDEDFLEGIYIKNNDTIYLSGTFTDSICNTNKVGLLSLDSDLNFSNALPNQGLIYVSNINCSCANNSGLVYISDKQFLLFSTFMDSTCSNQDHYVAKINTDTLDGISGINYTPYLHLYPNPIYSNDVVLKIDDIISQDIYIMIIDVMGKTISTSTIPFYQSGKDYHLTLPEKLTTGNYYVKINSRDINTVKKITVLSF